MTHCDEGRRPDLFERAAVATEQSARRQHERRLAAKVALAGGLLLAASSLGAIIAVGESETDGAEQFRAGGVVTIADRSELPAIVTGVAGLVISFAAADSLLARREER